MDKSLETFQTKLISVWKENGFKPPQYPLLIVGDVVYIVIEDDEYVLRTIDKFGNIQIFVPNMKTCVIKDLKYQCTKDEIEGINFDYTITTKDRFAARVLVPYVFHGD